MAANANSNPPKKGQEFTFPIALESATNPGTFLAAPTIAAGDFKIYMANAAAENLDNLPTVDPAGAKRVQVYLAAVETDFHNILVIWEDQTSPPEWIGGYMAFVTTA